MGKGVLQAVKNINGVIGPAILGMDPTQQKEIDELMVQRLDGTKNEWGCAQRTPPRLACLRDWRDRERASERAS